MSAPDHVVRVRNIAASVFLNPSTQEGKLVHAPRIALKSKFRGADGGVRYTYFLFPNEVPFALMALQKAFDWITENAHSINYAKSG